MSELEWLGVVRHAESVGNLAAVQAEGSGADRLDLSMRDADVPLSPLGEQQAAAVRAWLAALPPTVTPQVGLVSPYLRTVETARIATAGTGLRLAYDERLRDRDLGVLDLLSSHGVMKAFPQEAQRRARLGKFYYRPPGGESWADVALRLRSLLADLRRDHADGRVLLFTHDVVVQLLRYLLEDLREQELAEWSAKHIIANASIGAWQRDADGRLAATAFNNVEHLHAVGATPTREEGVRAEPV
jgi:2,3-bisphosphoglycerate-dependent phosphoglycerate mutase